MVVSVVCGVVAEVVEGGVELGEEVTGEFGVEADVDDVLDIGEDCISGGSWELLEDAGDVVLDGSGEFLFTPGARNECVGDSQ